MQENHHCVRNNMQNPCPMCSEVLFDSVKEISTLECGHAIHRKCLRQAVDGNIPACLVCQRTAEDDAITMEAVLKAFGVAQAVKCASEDVDSHCRNCHAISRVRYLSDDVSHDVPLYPGISFKSADCAGIHQ